MSKFTLDKAGNYGEVRSVNGIKPDEHGNVEVNAGGSDGPKVIHVKVTTSDGTNYTSSHSYHELAEIVYKGDAFVYLTTHDTRYDNGDTGHMHAYFYYTRETTPDAEVLNFKSPDANIKTTVGICYGGPDSTFVTVIN